MEALSDLVNESLARHGIQATLDHRRLQWSQWFRCESALSFAPVPSKPGVFTLAEASLGENTGTGRKRMLALFRISQTEDLGMALGRLFFPGSPERNQLERGQCFARYAVIEDPSQRQTAYAALKTWMESSAEAAFGLAPETGAAA
jgi:hypothetical protein